MAAGSESEAAAPFLETKPQVYFDGCPGCAMELRKAANPGVPYRLFFHVWIIIFVSCMCECIIYIDRMQVFRAPRIIMLQGRAKHKDLDV
jgi:hypothetical protein